MSQGPQVDNAIVGRDAVLKAMQPRSDDEGAIEIGADIARMGNDRTVLTKRKGLKRIATQAYTKMRTTEVCDTARGHSPATTRPCSSRWTTPASVGE